MRRMQRREHFDTTVATVMIGAALICWINAAIHHYKSAQHVLLALDVICPPFGIVFGALKLAGLV